MKGHPIVYSREEMAWLEKNRLMAIADYHRAFVKRFGREDVEAANLHSLRKRKRWLTGRTGQFIKGQSPANKGKKCPPGKGGRLRLDVGHVRQSHVGIQLALGVLLWRRLPRFPR